jgi:hypothetical protein
MYYHRFVQYHRQKISNKTDKTSPYTVPKADYSGSKFLRHLLDALREKFVRAHSTVFSISVVVVAYNTHFQQQQVVYLWYYVSYLIYNFINFFPISKFRGMC